MPEPISSKSLNSCESYEPAEAVCAAPHASAPSPSALSEAPQRPPAVEMLLAKHDAHAGQECRTEAVAVTIAAAHAAVSLIKLALSAPTEVGVSPAAGKFVADAIALGEAAATYLNCKAEQAKAAP